MGFSVKTFHSALNVDGDAQGYVGVANPTAYPVGAIVFISQTTAPLNPTRCVVTEQTASKLRLLPLPLAISGAPTGQTYGGGADMTAFTQAKGAAVDMEDQVVPERISP